MQFGALNGAISIENSANQVTYTGARRAPRATMETRIALIVAERGLTDRSESGTGNGWSLMRGG
jgi:hypothetical protein